MQRLHRSIIYELINHIITEINIPYIIPQCIHIYHYYMSNKLPGPWCWYKITAYIYTNNVLITIMEFHCLHCPMHPSNKQRHKFWLMNVVWSGGRAVERRSVNRGDGGSTPPTAVSKLRRFRLPHNCLCLSEETPKAGGPFYLVSMPAYIARGSKRSHSGGKCVTCSGLTQILVGF